LLGIKSKRAAAHHTVAHGEPARPGGDLGSGRREEFDQFIRAEIARWAKVIKDAGIPQQ
jgi:hypothetical protein